MAFDYTKYMDEEDRPNRRGNTVDVPMKHTVCFTMPQSFGYSSAEGREGENGGRGYIGCGCCCCCCCCCCKCRCHHGR